MSDASNFSPDFQSSDLSTQGLSTLEPAPVAKGTFPKSSLIVFLILIPVLSVVGYALGRQNTFGSLPSPSASPQACTDEAMICPDGSAVGRSGPNCEFLPCPSGEPKNSAALPVTCPVGEQNCNRWQTFIREDWGISFSYPADTLKPCQTGDALHVSFFLKEFDCPLGGDIVPIMRISAYPPGVVSSEDSDGRNIQLGGKDASEVVTKNDDDGPLSGVTSTKVYVKHNGKDVVVWLNENVTKPLTKKGDIESILYTFAFSREFSSTTLKHQNQNLGLSFSYPSDYQVKQTTPQLPDREFSIADGPVPPKVLGQISVDLKNKVADVDYNSEFPAPPVLITVMENPDRLSPNDWYSTYQFYPNSFTDFKLTDFVEEQRPTSDIFIGGRSAKDSVYNGAAGYNHTILIPVDDKMVLAHIIAQTPIDQALLLKKIVATMQFEE